MIDLLGQPLVIALIGAVGGIMLGLAARLGRFCTLGAIEDAIYGGSTVRLRMWGMAIGVAVMGAFTLDGLGFVTLTNSFHLAAAFSLPAAVVGGLMFGYGMALAGNCGFGALARLGGGDLRSFVVVLVMGLAAYSVLSGPFAALRVGLFPRVPVAGTPSGIAHAIGAITGGAVPLIGVTIGALITGATLLSAPFRAERLAVFWGTVVGLAIILGWAGSAWVARNGFGPQPLVSHNFSSPVGETLLYIMQGSARPLSFGVGSVSGVWLGAFFGSLYLGHFRWEACEDPRELRRQIFGAALMGVGAVIALGCTIGQGISAASVLAYSAPVTLASIIAGTGLGLRQLIEGFGPTDL